MRIVYDDHIFSWQKYGGISRYFYELAKALSLDPSLLVKVISPFHVNEYFDLGPRHIFSGMKSPSGYFLEKGYRMMNRSLTPLYRRKFQPDIFHETYYSNQGESVGGAKRVLTVFDMIHEKLPQYFHPQDKTPARKATAVNRADHIICISENTRSDLMEILNVPYEKTSVVNLGFSFEPYQDKLTSINESLPFLLYVGQRSGYKNFSGLIDVYADNPFLKNNFELIAFGGGKFTKDEEEKMRFLNLDASRIKQIDGDDDVLRALYSKASLFIYPSKYEGFGIPPLEAMSMGCPVACSDTSSLPEVVGDGAILFDPNSFESMTESILRCLTDDRFRGMLINKGKARVQQFSWHKCAQDTKAIYAKILS